MNSTYSKVSSLSGFSADIKHKISFSSLFMYLQMLRFSLKLIVLLIVSFQLFSHIVQMISKNNPYVK